MSVRRRWLLGLLVLVSLPAALGVGLTARLWDTQRDYPMSLQAAALAGEGLLLLDIVGQTDNYRLCADIGVPPDLHAARDIGFADSEVALPLSILPVSLLVESPGSGDPQTPYGLSAFLDVEGDFSAPESVKVTWSDEAAERWDQVPFKLPIVWHGKLSLLCALVTPFTLLIDGLSFPVYAVCRVLPGTEVHELFWWLGY